MNDLPEPEHPGVTKIKQMWERGDFETIDRMVQWWEAFENLGRLGGLLKKFILWSGVVAGGYFALTGHLAEWIKNVK